MKQLIFIICLLINICGNAYAVSLDNIESSAKNNSIPTESTSTYNTRLIIDNTNANIRVLKESTSTNTKVLPKNYSASSTKVIINESSVVTDKAMSILYESSTAINESHTTSDISLADLDNTSSLNQSESTENALDPHENFNRNAYRMNNTLDTNFVRPVTVWYVTYVPGFIRSGAQNFFNNLRDFVTLGNDILQLSTYRSLKDTGRVCINSTIGILGLFDVASHWGMPEHINTFGHTMRFYGWEHSSYVVLPFFGPSTIRDALGMIPDTFFNPTWWINYPYSNYVSVGLFTVSNLDARAKLLPFDQSLNTAIDPYSSMRDFYLQSSGNLPVNSSESSINEVQIDGLINDEN